MTTSATATAVQIRRKPDGSREKLVDLSSLAKDGWGDRSTLTRIVREKGIPAVQVGGRGRYKIWESDLPLLLEPVSVDEA